MKKKTKMTRHDTSSTNGFKVILTRGALIGQNRYDVNKFKTYEEVQAREKILRNSKKILLFLLYFQFIP